MQQVQQKPDELSLKQSYLRQQILLKGYDAEEFVAFLNDQLNINSNIELCSLPELKEVVRRFLDIKSKQEEQGSEEIKVILPQTQNNIKKPKLILFKQFTPIIIEEQFEEEVKCIKLVDKYVNRSAFKCQVNWSPERKHVGGVLGIGSTSFLQFKVWTHGLDWCVGRRYSDFIWLRNCLLKFYPSYIIPPIPDKKASKRTPRHIEKRMRILTLFLNDLILIPEIFNSRFVQGFLSLKDSKFQTLKKQSDNRKAFQSTSSTQTLTGKCKIKLTTQNVEYYQQTNKYVAETERLYKLLTRNSKNLQKSIIDKVNTLYEMGNQFGLLFQLANNFKSKVKSEGMNKLQDIYVTLNNLMIQWGNHLKQSVDLIEVNFNTFFKYVREQFMGYKELLKREADLQEQWSKAKIALDKKKQKIFLLHDTSKWELPKSQIPLLSKSCVHQKKEAFNIMLPKESVIVEQLRNNMAYYLSRIQENCQKNFMKTANRFCQNFRQFTIKSKVTAQQVGILWMEMSANFSQANRKSIKLKSMPRIQTVQDSKIQQYDD